MVDLKRRAKRRKPYNDLRGKNEMIKGSDRGTRDQAHKTLSKYIFYVEANLTAFSCEPMLYVVIENVAVCRARNRRNLTFANLW